ncbi:MAG: helix-turn-helix transcriptional regulator [Actinobacteria bacterium]|nr:helix-turn-helix transcriptional regulator [Actinomycetota bacterium]
MTAQSVASAVETAIYPMPVLPTHHQRRLIRESAGLSINALARVVGTTRFSVRNWESGVTEPSARFDLTYRRALAAMQAA